MNKKVKIGIVIAAITLMAAIGVLAFTLPPSGLTIQSSWSSNTVLGSGTLHYEGTISNHENKTATSVQLVLMLFDSRDFMIKTETLNVGDIPAQGSKHVSVDIQYSSLMGVSRVQEQLTWDRR